jgi:hypothetical protein
MTVFTLARGRAQPDPAIELLTEERRKLVREQEEIRRRDVERQARSKAARGQS